MALQLLDGTNALISFKMGSVAGTAPPTYDYTAVANYWSSDINRDFFEATTFASGGWRARIPGMKQVTGRMVGFASKGENESNPFIPFLGTTNQQGVPWVALADTGCSFTGTVHAERVHTGFQAALQSEFGIDFESTGPVTVAWVTA